MLLSAAMSADGYLDDASGHVVALSDAADWDRVDELRATSDAIMVGARTIRTDNPRLRVRSAERRQRRAAAGLPPNPRRVTVTGTGDLDPHARFFASEPVPPLVYAPAAVAGELSAALSRVATLVAVPARPGGTCAGRVDLAWLLSDLAARGVGRLMVEGGASVLGQFLSEGLADEFQLAVAPVFVADPAAPRLLGDVRPGALTGRMHLAGLTQAGDMAVLRLVPGKPG